MTITLRFSKTNIILALLGLGVVISIVIAATADGTTNSGDWPAWVQAVGSIAAILVAVWVPYQQREDAAADERDQRKIEGRRVQLAIRDELKLLDENFATGPNVAHLLALPSGEIFNCIIPIPPERFPIYKAVIGRLTLIDDDDQRREIIAAYEWAAGMIFSAAQNNQLLYEYVETAEKIQRWNTPYYVARLEDQKQNLILKADEMRSLCTQVINRVRALIANLDAAVAQ
jgi:uncharacterized membrane protein